MISTQEELIALQQQLRRQLTESIAEVIKTLKEALPSHASKLDAVLMVESRLNEANRDKLRGVIGQEDLQLIYNQIRAALLDLIGSLELKDFAAPSSSRPQPDKTGSLLYKIPGRMPLGEESKCIIRLAFEEESIIRNIELDEDVTLKPIRIAQVMDVELVDPNPDATFSIRTLSSSEQFVERGDYTEWLFFVKPLREGTFPLLVKVSVIELIQGKERKKEIVLEEEVQIVTTGARTEPESLPFKPSGYSLSYGAPPPPQAGATGIEPIAPPRAGEVVESYYAPPAPAPQPQVKQPSARRRSLVRPLSIAASFLLIATFAVYVFLPGSYDSNEHGDVDLPVATETLEKGEQDLEVEFQPLLGSWVVNRIETTPEYQARQDADFEVASPIYYTFREDNTLAISSRVTEEIAGYSLPEPNKVLIKGQTWDGAGLILYQSADSLALQLTISYPGGYEFPMTVQFLRSEK